MGSVEAVVSTALDCGSLAQTVQFGPVRPGLGNHGKLRTYAPRLLQAFEFKAAPTVQGLVEAVNLLLHSFDFAQVAALQRAGAWDEAGKRLGTAARHLQEAGALLIAANTMHLAAPHIEVRVDLPLLHIVDSTAGALQAAAFTMEQPFYRERLQERFGVQTIVPEAPVARPTCPPCWWMSAPAGS